MIGAPAGQPEFAGWAAELGSAGAAIPFLRYLPEHLGSSGARIQAVLRERLGEAPSFVAFEGYDAITSLAHMMRSNGIDRESIAESWASIAVEGTRGPISFSRVTGTDVWQWAWPPVQIVDRDPVNPDSFRVLFTSLSAAN